MTTTGESSSAPEGEASEALTPTPPTESTSMPPDDGVVTGVPLLLWGGIGLVLVGTAILAIWWMKHS